MCISPIIVDTAAAFPSLFPFIIHNHISISCYPPIILLCTKASSYIFSRQITLVLHCSSLHLVYAFSCISLHLTTCHLKISKQPSNWIYVYFAPIADSKCSILNFKAKLKAKWLFFSAFMYWECSCSSVLRSGEMRGVCRFISLG